MVFPFNMNRACLGTIQSQYYMSTRARLGSRDTMDSATDLSCTPDDQPPEGIVGINLGGDTGGSTLGCCTWSMPIAASRERRAAATCRDIVQ